jgi:hypothetical protein
VEILKDSKIAMGKEVKRKRFNTKVLERYEFVESILNYLQNKCNLRTTLSKRDKNIGFYSGTRKENGKLLPVAIVGYGGSGKDLRDLPTPLQTELLPLIFEHWNKISDGNIKTPLIILGHSFDEVFLRKIRLLKVVIKDIRLIQFINVDRFRSLEERFQKLDNYYDTLLKNLKIKNEKNDFQAAIVKYLKSGEALGKYRYDILDCEVPAGEGTIKSEVIDILAVERERKWLTVIELKYEKLPGVRLQSVIFQGLDYCNWVEDHKRGLAMLFPNKVIDVRRRTRLILINGPDKFPVFQTEFAKACRACDPYQEIEFYYTNDNEPLVFSSL